MYTIESDTYTSLSYLLATSFPGDVFVSQHCHSVKCENWVDDGHVTNVFCNALYLSQWLKRPATVACSEHAGRKEENSMDDSDNEDDFEILFMPIVKFVGTALNPRRRLEYGV